MPFSTNEVQGVFGFQMGCVRIIDNMKAWDLLKKGEKISTKGHLTRKRELDEEILQILEDQYPHSIAEIASRVKLSTEKIQLYFYFLAKSSLITYDEQSKKAVICYDFS
jgi:predicted transcriptional regulator